MLLKPAKIHLLSETTINQIAAGEVVENPASVIKELVENSIDAGASEICIEIQAGGLGLIRILDNGSGMSEEDLLLSIQRHATSKISAIEDINSLHSLGFRGEALASIASISKLTMISAEEGAFARKLEIEGGSKPILSKAARTRGTTIEIRSLFYNVPARRKFQKSPALCKGEIHRLIQILALCHTDIRFEIKDETRTFFSSGDLISENFFAGLQSRIITIHGKELMENCLQIDAVEKGCHLRGFIGNTFETRPNRQNQFLFVNKRPVSSAPLSFAVKNGFGQRLPDNRFPLFFLHLELSGHEVDVNVHPQKKEVRFQNEAFIKSFVAEKVSSALTGRNTRPHFFHQEAPKDKQLFTFSYPQAPSYLSEKSEYKQEQIPLPFEIKRRKALALFGRFLILESTHLPEISCEKPNSLILVDIREAAAQIAYENLEMKEKQPSQIEQLLIPISLSLSKVRAEKLLELLPRLNEIGFEIRPLTPGHFIIEALPAGLPHSATESLLLTLIDSDKEGEKILPLSALQIAKTPSTIEEGEKIVERLLKARHFKRSFQGKKIITDISYEALEKLFC